MKVLIFDSESNGFLEEATKLWCIATLDRETGVGTLFKPADIQRGLAELHTADVLVGHNIKKHDLQLFKKLYDWEPNSHQIIIDTVIFSRMLNPKRPNPNGYTGNAPHSIEAWGYRLGLAKPEHEDWSKYTAAMGKRCLADTRINLLVLEALESEAGNLSNYYEQLKSPASLVA